MTFRIVIDPIAQEQIDQLAEYLRGYSEDFATEQIARLDRILHLISAKRRSHGPSFLSLGRRTAAISSGLADEPSTGSYMPSTSNDGLSMSFCFGTRAAIRNQSTFEC